MEYMGKAQSIREDFSQDVLSPNNVIYHMQIHTEEEQSRTKHSVLTVKAVMEQENRQSLDYAVSILK